MQEQLRDLLYQSLTQQVDKYYKQVKRQTCPSLGFSFKINSTQLRTAMAKQARGNGGKAAETAANSAESASQEDWAATVLAALEELFANIHTYQDALCMNSADGETEEVLPIEGAVSALGGIELRHCRLQARHVGTAKEEGDKEPCLTRCLLLTAQQCSTFIALASPSLQCPFLTTLDLECNLLGDDGVHELCKNLLDVLPSLQRLLLASNCITSRGFLELLGCLTKLSTAEEAPLQLETLGLTNNPVGCSSVAGNVAASESSAGEPTALAPWKGAVDAFVHSSAPTLRRIHLRHASLSTPEVAALIAALFRHTFAEQSECVFDLVYLRENKLVVKEDALQLLHDVVSDKEALSTFLEKHVSW